MVNFQSGLLGISETSSDMRDLLDHEAQDVRAAEAVALVLLPGEEMDRRVRGGVRRTGHASVRWRHRRERPPVRARICKGLGFLGVELAEKRNVANEGVISAAASRVVVRVIHTDEELMIAGSVARLLSLGILNDS